MTASARELVAAAVDRLRASGVETPYPDVETLLAFVLGTTRGALLADPGVDDDQRQEFEELLERRTRREPLQHITGVAPFRYLELAVGPGVFVPRPETELVAGVAIEELNRLVDSGIEAPRAVDLCTGSGAVAIAMATEVPGVQVAAVDKSQDAVAWAERNVTGSGVDLRCGDMAVAFPELEGRVHVVTANPPYIPLAAYESVEVEVRDFDPAAALWSGEDGLDAIRLVAARAGALLVDGGLVVCEHADVQGEVAPALFSHTGDWTQVRDHVDLAGRPRFVTARRVPRRGPRAGTIAP